MLFYVSLLFLSNRNKVMLFFRRDVMVIGSKINISEVFTDNSTEHPESYLDFINRVE